jgi:hypothetical protein
MISKLLSCIIPEGKRDGEFRGKETIRASYFNKATISRTA